MPGSSTDSPPPRKRDHYDANMIIQDRDGEPIGDDGVKAFSQLLSSSPHKQPVASTDGDGDGYSAQILWQKRRESSRKLPKTDQEVPPERREVGVGETVVDVEDLGNKLKKDKVEDLGNKLKDKAAICATCTAPCAVSCPLKLPIKELHALVVAGNMKEAWDLMCQHNVLPEFTGTACGKGRAPPCEQRCPIDQEHPPQSIERLLFDWASKNEMVQPMAASAVPTGKQVCVVGSGTTGLAAALHLKREGHAVTVYERRSTPGPEYDHIPPAMVQSRIEMMKMEGIVFRSQAIGEHGGLSMEDLAKFMDAVVLAVREVPPGAKCPSVRGKVFEADVGRQDSVAGEMAAGRQAAVSASRELFRNIKRDTR